MKKYEQNNKTTDRIWQRKNTAPMRCVFSFWYVIERFSSLHCSFVNIQSWGMLLPSGRYILIGVYLCRIVLGGNNRHRHNCNNNHNGYLLRYRKPPLVIKLCSFKLFLIYHFCVLTSRINNIFMNCNE